MPTINKESTQANLDALRLTRSKLYSIPELELNAMSLEDQVKYGDSLHQTGLAILKLEAAKLKGVNDKFKKKEKDLTKACADLESDLASAENAVKAIRVASESIALVSDIIKLLG